MVPHPSTAQGLPRPAGTAAPPPRSPLPSPSCTDYKGKARSLALAHLAGFSAKVERKGECGSVAKTAPADCPQVSLMCNSERGGRQNEGGGGLQGSRERVLKAVASACTFVHACNTPPGEGLGGVGRGPA